MNENEIVQSVRLEIAKLQRVLDLLLDKSSAVEEVRKPGRPKGSKNRATSFDPEEFTPKKRTMSAEGKARIAAAQKKRWAAQKTTAPDRTIRKGAAATKTTSKKAPPALAKKLATTTKSAGAGKPARPLAAKRQAKAAPRKTTAKKSAIKRPGRSAMKLSAKQTSSASPETQTPA